MSYPRKWMGIMNSGKALVVVRVDADLLVNGETLLVEHKTTLHWGGQFLEIAGESSLHDATGAANGILQGRGVKSAADDWRWTMTRASVEHKTLVYFLELEVVHPDTDVVP
jgi:hypothetical protein